MTDDIVTRLREAATSNFGEYQLTMAPELCLAIADEIERLRAEVQDYQRTIRAWEFENAVMKKALQLACDDLSSFEAGGETSFDEHISQMMNEYIEEARRG